MFKGKQFRRQVTDAAKTYQTNMLHTIQLQISIATLGLEESPVGWLKSSFIFIRPSQPPSRPPNIFYFKESPIVEGLEGKANS